MIKLIVSDFDGTLLPYGQEALSAETKALLCAALNAGKTVAVSSGRTYGELISHLSEFEDRLWFICCDGAYTVRHGHSLYEKKIETEDLRFFFDSAAKVSCSFLLHGAKKTYAVGAIPSDTAFPDAIPVTRVTEIPEKIFKITSYCHPVKLPPYSGLRMHWDGGPLASAQYVNRFANKGAALSDLQMRLIVEPFDTAALGDSNNDIAMMHGAKYTYCIGNRSPALATVCSRHLPTAEQALDEIFSM